jgi:eukaryotic-like serine/threonine-protein kinase
MSLTSGSKLGPYEILSPLGAGGMGEVYSATQSSLGRQVAIKVLASASALDPERLRRFEQEARAASALNHPNIISIYDIGRENSTAYIAMELVDGKTLRSLLEAGPIPIKKTLQIATQIADGLAKAHAAGIVHRDLKPENVMVSRDGFVKILDFGLAKLLPSLNGSDSSSETMAMAMTAAAPGTHPGMVMGTAGYMSPEQARGGNVDYRSDIFSFGSMLYEMVAGKQPFKGASTAQTLTAIIEDDPQSVAEANPKTPTPLRWIIERCLAKDPDDRYTSTRDLARDLQSIRDHLSEATTSAQIAQAAPSAQRPKWLTPALIALAGLILGGALVFWLRPSAPATSATLRYLTFSGNDFGPSISPDGRTVAFVSGRDGNFRVWLKQLESGSETVLTPGPDDDSPRFSPDGAWILFTHNRAAYRVPSLGGEPRRILDNVDHAGWSPDGREIAFLRYETDGPKIASNLGIASVQDGTSRIVHRFENQTLRAPAWSPDGSTIALVQQRAGSVGTPAREVILVSADGQTVRELKCPLPGGELSAAAWANGSQSLIYDLPESAADSGGALTTTVGSAGHVLMQDVQTGKIRTLFGVQAPVSRIEIAGSGRLIFDSLTQRNSLKEFSSAPGAPSEGHWLTRGNSIDRQPYYSPDGESVIFSSSRSGDVDLWEVSTKMNSVRRLTDHPASDWDPFVTADGKHLLWSSNRSGHFEIWTAERDGSSPRQVTQDDYDAENPVATVDGWVVYASGNPAHPGLYKIHFDGTNQTLIVAGGIAWPDVSPDAKYALYHIVSSALRAKIRVVRLADGAPAQFEGSGQRARFSGDGKSIVYISERGQEIVRQSFPSAAGAPVKTLVPASPDLFIETFHITPDGRKVVVSYTQPSRSLVVADGVSGVEAPAPVR